MKKDMQQIYDRFYRDNDKYSQHYGLNPSKETRQSHVRGSSGRQGQEPIHTGIKKAAFAG